MKSANGGKHGTKRVTIVKLRKNAANKKIKVVIPVGGLDELRARIGAPFKPMDFRQLIERAKQKNPRNVDQSFEQIVHEITKKQLDELLSRMRIKPKDKNAYEKAFATLAFALLGAGLVVWSPAPPRTPRRTLQHDANLYWLVDDLKHREALSERAAIEKIASSSSVGSWFPYRPQRRTQISPPSGRRAALWQAWMKAKRLIGLDIADAPLPKAGKKHPR